MSENLEKTWSQKARKLGPEHLERWRLLSSDLELSEALLEFADYLEDADPGEAYWWYRASCDCDNANACMRLAWYLWDYACPRDYLDGDDWKERVDVYRRARKLGHPHTGIDINPLVKHSLEQLLKRARRGACWAKATVGIHFAAAYQPNHELAYAWLSVALEDADDPSSRSWAKERAALWFIERILDAEELNRAKALKEEIGSKYPRSMNLFWRTYYFFVPLL